MYKIRIFDRNKITVLTAEKGARLSDVLSNGGFFVDMLCGGNGKCEKCTLTVNGKKERACRHIINTDITVILPEQNTSVSDSGCIHASKKPENMCLALDIGTTTLALALVSPESGEAVRTLVCANSQRTAGADIMARIEYCRKSGVEKLQAAVINDINRLTGLLNLKVPMPLYVAGNTTMLHIFFGIDCSSLGTAPYTPVFLEPKTVSGESLGLKGVSRVLSLPCISAFAGADITAGLSYAALPENKKFNLLVDLGTNAEIALFNNSYALCTSAAAGPCFEGASICCGMSAVEGAVYSYRDGRARVIGGGTAKGICATGLIDIAAFLLEKGIVDESGYMQCEKYEIDRDVYITQGDIRQYQLAKSAVFSAICVLVDRSVARFDDIETVYVSGGFSEGFNAESAVKTGLFPNEFTNKTLPAGNSSLNGVIKYIREDGKLPEFIEKTKYADLSADPLFSTAFIKNMSFRQK